MKIYVGNLANSITDQELSDLFSAYGAVISARVIKDKFSGQSRGFGFVEMGDEEANAAITGLNGSDVKGQAIRASEARPPQERTGGGFGGNRGGGMGRGGFGGSRGGGFGGRGGDRFNR
ncbi:MAG: RNA-binding protein [Candidatus Babeliales bacterium]|jgi:RNA recognition motif-containing protein